jgi:2-polyprenyl-3-methyl-5-hydroxy-6-metoxy-1,4-benzoquinol methylase
MSGPASEKAAAFAPAGAQPVCIVCGGRRFGPRFRRGSAAPAEARSERPYRITHSERRLARKIVRCADCGMMTLAPPPAPSAAYADAEDPYYLEQGPQRIANAHRLLELVPSGGRLLEIGCACGFLLVAARERGFTVSGVEMSRWASEYARRVYDLDVETGDLEHLRLPAATYDVVVMADVIEHLTEPRRTLREIHRLLRRGGRLLLLTPDAGSLLARVTGTRWWSVLDDHYFYFSRVTLWRLLESEGFAVERMSALGRQFPIAHWVFKLSQYGSTVLYRTAARLTRVLRLDARELSINLGDQMACVARKK